MKRDTGTTVPMTKEELEKIRSNADALGLSLAGYIRMVSLRGGK